MKPNFNVTGGNGFPLPIPDWALRAIAFLAISTATLLTAFVLCAGVVLMFGIDTMMSYIVIGYGTQYGAAQQMGGPIWGAGVGICLTLAYLYMTKLVSSKQFLQHVDTLFEKAIMVGLFMVVVAGKGVLTFSAWTYLMYAETPWNVLPAPGRITMLYITTASLTLAFSLLAPWVMRKGLKLITGP